MSAAPTIAPERIEQVLARHPAGQAGALVNVLHDLQAEFRYLPQPALEQAAGHLGIPQAQLFGVATFYEGFHLKPRGEHIVTVCMGTACHVRGAPRLLEQAERDLKIRTGQTTSDLQFTLEQVNCVGACALGPLAIVDTAYQGSMTPDKLGKLLRKLQQKGND
jgi:NADH-quinone oxidoreductase subunit E